MNESSCIVVGRVCWPPGLTIPRDVPHASRLVCAHPEHQESAVARIEQITGHPGVFEKVPHG